MKRNSIVLIMVAGVLWGCLGIFVRRLNALGLQSMEIVTVRVIVTFAAMLVYLLIFHREYLCIRIRDMWCFLGTGIFSIIFFNYCYFKAIAMASLSVAAVLLYTAPAIVMVLSFFLFREKFSVRKVIALILTLIGCVLVTGILSDKGGITISGILFGMGAGLGYALYSIFGRYALERGYHTLTITFYTFLVAAIGVLFLTDLSQVAKVATCSAGTVSVCVALGILCTVVPYLAYTQGLKNIENSKASIIASVEPVTASILGVLLFQETISIGGIIGIACVLGALILCKN